MCKYFNICKFLTLILLSSFLTVSSASDIQDLEKNDLNHRILNIENEKKHLLSEIDLGNRRQKLAQNTLSKYLVLEHDVWCWRSCG